MSIDAINGLTTSSIVSSSGSPVDDWFEALAEAWGAALDNQAQTILDLSNSIGANGRTSPAVVVQLTTEAQRMNFMATSESTSITSAGQALETMARKQ